MTFFIWGQLPSYPPAQNNSIVMRVCCVLGGNKEALAVALSSGGQFIRAEGFVFAHVADEGWMDGCAGELLRYRRAVGAGDILVFTDVKKKHR